MKYFLGSLFLLSAAIARGADMIPVDTNFSGYKTPPVACSQYLRPGASKPGEHIDSINVRSVRGWITDDDRLMMQLALVPAVCTEVPQPEPEPPARKGMLFNPEGVSPDPADFVVGVAGTYGMIFISDRQLLGEYSVGDYLFNSVTNRHYVILQWRLKDIMDSRELRKYKEGKEVEVFIPVAYCTNNMGESKFRPKITSDLYDENNSLLDFRWRRIFDDKGNRRPANCLKFPNNLKTKLNANEEDPNYFVTLPSPREKFLELLNRYDKEGVKPNIDGLSGFFAGRCVYRQVPSKQFPGMLGGATVPNKYDPARLDFFMVSFTNLKQAPEYFETIDEKSLSDLKMGFNAAIKNGFGTSYISGEELRISGGDLRAMYLKKVPEGFLVKYTVYMETEKPFVLTNEPVRMCLLTKKLN